MSARGRALREAGAESKERIPLDLSFRDVSLNYKEFPYELKKVDGEITLEVDGSEVPEYGAPPSKTFQP